ncbi:shieldin complex subunit 3 [Mugil cephalus]|uniref:shieldin complex subunit 3 n=1 Tax=Mugil cephalus TaxID=48193 RepID=UPI001FB70128|nr:shieldin complex subunit 3 [Mugil cephalus]
MEDVVLHYRPGCGDGLGSLLERTEKLLEPFPCRRPPVFAPWFPPTADRQLPIRPAKPAPVITSNGFPTAETKPHPEGPPDEPKHHHHPPRKHKNGDEDGLSSTPSPSKRSWSIFTRRRAPQQSSSPLLSKRFRHVVSVHGLHLHQRVRWVIGEHNCGPARDMEQVWRTLSRLVRTSKLPTCNANIQRERAEIWAFCDVLYSEQVGRFLKDELQLSGRIVLSVRRLEAVFSL